MSTITETVPGLGDTPSTADTATFDARGDLLFGTSLPASIAAMNVAFGQVNVVTAEVDANAVQVAADTVTASAAAAASIAGSNATLWVSGGPFVVGAARFSPTTFLSFRCKADNTGTVDPASDPTNWEPLTRSGSGTNSFTASGAITENKACFLRTDGKAQQSAIAVAAYAASANIDGGNYSNMSLCLDPVNNRVILFYRDPDAGVANSGNARLGTFSGGSITWSAEVSFSAVAITGEYSAISSAYDPDTGQILILYNVGGVAKCKLATVDVGGDTITFGTELNTDITVQEVSCCYDESVNLFLCTHRESAAFKAFTLLVSGTSLSIQTTNTIYASSISGHTSQAVFLKGHATGMSAVIANVGSVAYIWLIKITPGTFVINASAQLAPNAPDSYNGYASGDQCMAWSESKQCLVVLSNSGGGLGNYYLYCAMYTTNGTSFTKTGSVWVDFGFFSVPYAQFPSIMINADGESVSIIYPDQSDSNFGKVRCSTTFTTATMSLSTETQFYGGAVNFTAQVPSLDGLYSLCCYNLNAHSTGRNFVITYPVLDNRTKFIGFANGTVADGATVELSTLGATVDGLAGLAVNTKYYLSVSDGQTLTAGGTGPNVLYAIAADKGIVTGSQMLTI